LEDDDLFRISALPGNRASAIKVLVRLSYDKDTLVGQRAIRAMGSIAREMLKADPEFLRETCRKLLWSLSDESAASAGPPPRCWARS
jgi:hypothetical protein